MLCVLNTQNTALFKYTVAVAQEMSHASVIGVSRVWAGTAGPAVRRYTKRKATGATSLEDEDDRLGALTARRVERAPYLQRSY